MRICEAYTRSMKVLQAFQVAAREDGFIEVEECGEGTVLWLRKQTKDTKTHQRLCIDSLLKSVTIYRTNVSRGGSRQSLSSPYTHETGTYGRTATSSTTRWWTIPPMEYSGVMLKEGFSTSIKLW